MTLTKIKLGTLIELCEERNKNNEFNVTHVVGISTQKMFIETKADMDGVSVSSYKLVKPFMFAYVSDTSRRGNKISLAYNQTTNIYLVSSISTIFKVKRTDLLDSDYLFMYFNRPEFDRYSRFNSWGSARETFSWKDMCDIDFELPPIDIQRKYVAIYKSMVANQKAYETGLEDLKLTCDAYVENLRKRLIVKPIGKYICRGTKNSNSGIINVLGVGQYGFMSPQKSPNESLKGYKVMMRNSICYAPPLYNINADAIHLYSFNKPAICSPIYEVFNCDETNLLSSYLIIWLKRKEFKRYAHFYALGVRNTFNYELMEEFKIPIPDLNVQKSIGVLYSTYFQRKQINEQLKNQIKDICPILIKGSIEEVKKAVI